MILNDASTIWLFDYDLTLYFESERAVLNSLDRRISLYVQKILGCDFEKAQEIRKEYLRDYGTTLAGLRAKFGVSPDDFFDFIHEPEFLIYPEPAPQKREFLMRLKGPRYIFTNGRSDWSRTGCKRMGIYDCFRRIVGLEDLNWEGKPQISAYEKMESVLIEDGVTEKIFPEKIILLDDSLKNLKPAAERGWRTIWVNSSLEPKPNFVHAKVENLIKLGIRNEEC